jgi:iron complex outermembrane receptor protein
MARNSIFTALRIGTASPRCRRAPASRRSPSRSSRPAPPLPTSSRPPPPTRRRRTSSSTQDQDIVVTARRRAESLQDVPIAVTAYSGERWSGRARSTSPTFPTPPQRHARDLARHQHHAHRLHPRRRPAGSGRRLRAGVGLYLDDVFLNRPQAPCSTSTTSSGSRCCAGRRARSTAATRSAARSNMSPAAAATIPSSASAPISAPTSRRPDRQRQHPLGRRHPDRRLGRAAQPRRLRRQPHHRPRQLQSRHLGGARHVELEPTDAFFIRISGDYTKDNSRSAQRPPADPEPAQRRAGARRRVRHPRRAQHARAGGRGLWRHRAARRARSSATAHAPNITAYRKDKSFTPIDFDALPAPTSTCRPSTATSSSAERIPAAGTRAAAAGRRRRLLSRRQRQQHLRRDPGTTGARSALPGFTASTFGDVDTKTWAVFGDFTYDFTDQFSLSLGGRYTNDKREAVVIRRNLIGGASPELGGINARHLAATNPTGASSARSPPTFQGEKTFKEFTPRASVSFEPNDDNTFYASYSKGFKGGGFDPRGLSTAAPDLNGNGTRERRDLRLLPVRAGKGRQLRARLQGVAVRPPPALRARRLLRRLQGRAGARLGRRGRQRRPDLCRRHHQRRQGDVQGHRVRRHRACSPATSPGRLAAQLVRHARLSRRQYDEFITNVAGFDANGQSRPPRPPGRSTWPTSGASRTRPSGRCRARSTYSTPLAGGDLNANHRLLPQQDLPVRDAEPVPRPAGLYAVDASLVWTSPDDRFTIGLHGKNLTDKQYITSGYQFLASIR